MPWIFLRESFSFSAWSMLSSARFVLSNEILAQGDVCSYNNVFMLITF